MNGTNPPPPDDDEPNFGPDPWGDLFADIDRDMGQREEPEFLTNRDS